MQSEKSSRSNMGQHHPETTTDDVDYSADIRSWTTVPAVPRAVSYYGALAWLRIVIFAFLGALQFSMTSFENAEAFASVYTRQMCTTFPKPRFWLRARIFARGRAQKGVLERFWFIFDRAPHPNRSVGLGRYRNTVLIRILHNSQLDMFSTPQPQVIMQCSKCWRSIVNSSAGRLSGAATYIDDVAA